MKRILRNGFNDTFKAKVIDGADAHDQLFIWKQNFKVLEKMAIGEEKRSFKRNAIKSKSSRIRYNLWRKFEEKAALFRYQTISHAKQILIKRGLLYIDVANNEPIEVFANENLQLRFTQFEASFLQLLTRLKDYEKALLDLHLIKSTLAREDYQSNLRAINQKITTLFQTLTMQKAALLRDVNQAKAQVLKPSVISLKTIRDINFETKKLKTKALAVHKKTERVETVKLLKGLSFWEKRWLDPFVNQKQLAINTAILPILESNENLCYELEFKAKNAREKIRHESEMVAQKLKHAKQLVFLRQKVKTIHQDKIALAKEKEAFKAHKHNIKQTWKKAKLETKQKLKAGNASRRAKDVAYKNLSVEFKTQIREARLHDSKLFNAKNHLSDARNNIYHDLKKQRRLHHANLKDILKSSPIEISKRTYWTRIVLGSIFPGLGALLSKQYAKATLQLALSALMVIILAWIFGAFPSASGNGIAGLINLGFDSSTAIAGVQIGLTNGKSNDGRFYLVMGTLALIMLLIIIAYWLISILSNINANNLARTGVRYTNWRMQKQILKTVGIPYLLSIPAFIFIIFIVILPVLATLLITFTNINERFWDQQALVWRYYDGIVYPFSWSGVSQYSYIFSVVGNEFAGVLGWTIIWTFGSATVVIVLGTFFAILVNQERIKGKTLFRVIYLLPWAIPAFISIMFFSIFFQHDGIFNRVIGDYLFGQGTDWTNDGAKTKALMIFLQGWLGHSYIFLLITGIIQSIPRSLYEASRMDGATSWKQFRTITFPIILIQVAPMLIGQFTFAFNNFSFIYLFNKGGISKPGEIAGETDIFISWIYKLINNSSQSRPGAAAAISLIVSIFTVTPSALLFVRSKSFRRGDF